MQDPTVRVGVCYLQVTSDAATVAEVSIPLVLHNTNSGNISRSGYEQLEVYVRSHLARADINRLTTTYSTDAVTPVISFTEETGAEGGGGVY